MRWDCPLLKHDVRLLAAAECANWKETATAGSQRFWRNPTSKGWSSRPTTAKALALHFLDRRTTLRPALTRNWQNSLPPPIIMTRRCCLPLPKWTTRPSIRSASLSMPASVSSAPSAGTNAETAEKKTSAYRFDAEMGHLDNNQQASSTTGTGSSPPARRMKKGTDISYHSLHRRWHETHFHHQQRHRQSVLHFADGCPVLAEIWIYAAQRLLWHHGQKSDTRNLAAGSKVIIRAFKWGNKVLRDVKYTIVADPQAPILITQKAERDWQIKLRLHLYKHTPYQNL